jgi:hypothetical protein
MKTLMIAFGISLLAVNMCFTQQGNGHKDPGHVLVNPAQIQM